VGRFTKTVEMRKYKNIIQYENEVTQRKLMKYQLSWKRVHRMQSCRIRKRVNGIILNIQTLEEPAVNRKKKKSLLNF